MTILRRVETLEAALLHAREDASYKLVLLEEGESYEDSIMRLNVQDWPTDRIIVVKFVSADDKLVL